MRKMTNLSMTWGIVMIGLFALLLYYSVYYTKNENYIKLEKEMERVVKQEETFQKGIDENDFYIIESSQLEKYIDFSVENDKCAGRVEVKNTFLGKWYRAIIDCSEYKTFRIK